MPVICWSGKLLLGISINCPHRRDLVRQSQTEGDRHRNECNAHSKLEDERSYKHGESTLFLFCTEDLLTWCQEEVSYQKTNRKNRSIYQFLHKDAGEQAKVSVLLTAKKKKKAQSIKRQILRWTKSNTLTSRFNNSLRLGVGVSPWYKQKCFQDPKKATMDLDCLYSSLKIRDCTSISSTF